MRWIKFVLTLIIVTSVLDSCKKDINITSSIASLTVINASVDNPSIVATISDTMMPFYINVASVAYASFAEYGTPGGTTPIMIVSSTDTARPLFQGKFDLKAGGIYSLYISGQIKNLDTLLLRDFPVSYSDSLSGVRFINLSAGSRPISVNLQGNLPSQMEFSNLSYKQASAFKTYPATSASAGYNFEVRDQTSGNLLATFTWNFSLFKNHTLVIAGSEELSSTTPINVFRVNNF